MAVITMPTGGIRSVAWSLPRHPTFAVKSGWTGKQQVVDIGPTTGFTAQVDVVPGNVAHVQAWRAFFAALKGLTNEFFLEAVEADQCATVLGAVNGGGQTGTTLSVKGLPASTTVLPAGAMIAPANALTAGDLRLFVLTAPLVSNGSGIAAATLATPIITAYPNDASVRLARPGAIMRLSNPETGWSIEPGNIYRPFSFQCEEVI